MPVAKAKVGSEQLISAFFPADLVARVVQAGPTEIHIRVEPVAEAFPADPIPVDRAGPWEIPQSVVSFCARRELSQALETASPRFAKPSRRWSRCSSLPNRRADPKPCWASA